MLPQIKTILYTSALGPDAAYVFRYALALARQHQAKIVAVHAMEPLSLFGKSLVEQYVSHESVETRHNEALESVRTGIKQRMEQLCAKECNNATSCENAVSSVHVVDGYPEQVILDTAKECSADLIVMGAHGHTRVEETFMGSTTRKVLHSASQPVLVVKIPKNYQDEL